MYYLDMDSNSSALVAFCGINSFTLPCVHYLHGKSRIVFLLYPWRF